MDARIKSGHDDSGSGTVEAESGPDPRSDRRLAARRRCVIAFGGASRAGYMTVFSIPPSTK
jgi:hypothetical protein